MRKSLLYLQSLILLGGVVFAWYTVFGDFSRFIGAGYPITQFQGCSVPNPLATPCFYGAIMFIVTLILSLIILSAEDALKKSKNQKILLWLLLAGALFAWSNFGYQLYKFYAPRTGIYIGCSGIAVTHPVYTPCFTGAVIYLAAFIVSFIIIKIFKHDL